MKNTIEGKVVILGAMDVGKTSIISRYVHQSFHVYATPTLGASFFIVKIDLDEEVIVKLQIWDTAGQERFRSMAPLYYRNANAALLVFDLTDMESFNSVKTWVTELKRHVEQSMCLVLVGNKLDLVSKRVVSRDEGIQYANSIGGLYFEASALENRGIDQIFTSLASFMLRSRNHQPGKDDDSDGCESTMTAQPTNQRATDVGKTEIPRWSIDSVALAETKRPHRCC